MQLAGWLTVILFIALIAGGGVAAILIFCNPFTVNSLIFFLFYFLIFLSTSGLFALIGFLIKRLIRSSKRVSQKQILYHLKNSFRQGIFLGLLLIALLFLQSQKLLFWWTLLGLVLIIALLEWYFAGRK